MEKIIIGLGNPGQKYHHTRHNAGWLVLDRLVQELLGEPPHWENKPRLFAQIIVVGHNLLVKPTTMMNDSGRSVRAIVDYYNLTPADFSTKLLVIHDDLDLPLGQTRWSKNSRSAGHKGVQSIIDALGTQTFNRWRLGIKPASPLLEEPATFVLNNFSPLELQILQALSLKPIYNFLEGQPSNN